MQLPPKKASFTSSSTPPFGQSAAHASSEKLKIFFPYESVREEQKTLIADVAAALRDGKILLAHAPTGLGKTVSSLAPAVAYAIEHNKKVFFLTPKTSQHAIVLETIQLMNERFGQHVKAVDLVGRKQMCLDPLLMHLDHGFYEACSKKKKEHMCAFYNNTKGHTPKQKAEAQHKKSDVISVYGKGYMQMKDDCEVRELCPYEVTLEMLKKADVIIGDYFHLFNDEMRAGILEPAGITLADCIVVIDEAHNLPKRLRDMLADSLESTGIEKAGKEARNVGDFEVEFLTKDIAKEVLSLAKKLSLDRNEAMLGLEDLDMLRKIAKHGAEKCEATGYRFMEKNKAENSFLLSMGVFLSTFMHERENTMYLIERRVAGLRLSVYPLDTADFGASVLGRCHAAVLMSGTLLPLEMYADVLGISGSKVVCKEYKSPFPPENRLNLFVDKTTTRYTSRGSEQYKEIASTVDAIVGKVPGNVIVFFPSFELLETVRPILNTRRRVLVQERDMGNDVKTKLISDFKILGQGFGGVLLAVSGGSIAEGVDFPGEHLLCAIVVGIPFARVNVHSDALIRFYEQKFGKGWDYAYNAPAISKAVQAAGRVIRTETDKGVCVFLDSRFAEDKYKRFFPKDFVATRTLVPEKLVEAFFAQN